MHPACCNENDVGFQRLVVSCVIGYARGVLGARCASDVQFLVRMRVIINIDDDSTRMP